MKTPSKPAGSDFLCGTDNLARSLRWTGVLADGKTPINLTDADNFANTNALYIPPRSLPLGKIAVFTFTVCYADAPPDPRLCGVQSTSFAVASSPLTAKLSGVNTIVGA